MHFVIGNLLLKMGTPVTATSNFNEPAKYNAVVYTTRNFENGDIFRDLIDEEDPKGRKPLRISRDSKFLSDNGLLPLSPEDVLYYDSILGNTTGIVNFAFQFENGWGEAMAALFPEQPLQSYFEIDLGTNDITKRFTFITDPGSEVTLNFEGDYPSQGGRGARLRIRRLTEDTYIADIKLNDYW